MSQVAAWQADKIRPGMALANGRDGSPMTLLLVNPTLSIPAAEEEGPPLFSFSTDGETRDPLKQSRSSSQRSCGVRGLIKGSE
jgi:hypothetical protein